MDRILEWQESFINKIICGNCVDVMRQMPDKCVDLVLTDPPYGIGEKYNEYDDTEENLKKLIDDFMPEALRVGKIVALTPGNKNIFLYPKPDWILSWVVPQETGVSKWGFICWHAILVYGKDPYLANRKGSRPDIIDSRFLKSDTSHPCAKPISVWKKLLDRCSVKKTDIILDPFIGSGTTAVACKELTRRYIGIELSPEYCEMAEKRVFNTHGSLF